MPKGMLKTSRENDLAARIRQALGVSGDEPISVVTPQFKRPKNWPKPEQAPLTIHEFSGLSSLSDEKLLKLGLGRWGRLFEHKDGTESGPMLWLFPQEWYKYIPEGFEITSITFKKEKFEPGKTDDDIRFGCLSYGILKEEK